MGREVTFLDDIHRYKSYVFSDAYAGRGWHAAPRHRLSAGFRGLEFRLFYWRLHLGRGVCVWAWGTDIYHCCRPTDPGCQLLGIRRDHIGMERPHTGPRAYIRNLA